ncbi:hypothetical protein Tco_0598134 [Tanacetum coccineum]
MAREAWGLSMDSSDYAHSDVMSLRTTVVAQSALISELQSADHKRQKGGFQSYMASDHRDNSYAMQPVKKIMGYSQLQTV